MSAVQIKPVPVSDPVSEVYFQGLRVGELRIQRCSSCGTRQHYPRPFCMTCMSDDVQFEVDTGHGVVYAFTIVRLHYSEAFKSDLPIVAILVELKDGGRILSTLEGVEADPKFIKIGMPVKVFFDRVSDDVTLPRFRPA
jgi:uncharacterized OB-fold protein